MLSSKLLACGLPNAPSHGPLPPPSRTPLAQVCALRPPAKTSLTFSRIWDSIGRSLPAWSARFTPSSISPPLGPLFPRIIAKVIRESLVFYHEVLNKLIYAAFGIFSTRVPDESLPHTQGLYNMGAVY